MGILNTMDKEIISAKTLLKGMGISLLDAARLVRNILDSLPKNSSIAPIQFCAKVIEVGKRNIRSKEMRFSEGFFLYLQTNLAYPNARNGSLRPSPPRANLTRLARCFTVCLNLPSAANGATKTP